MAYAKIRPRRATLAEWTMINPIIAEGELVIEHPNTGVGTGPVRFKIGDGFKPYNDLPYAFDAEAANAIFGGNVYDWHEILLRTDSYDNWMSEDPIPAKGEPTYDKTHRKIKVGDGVTPWSKLPYIGPDFNHGDYDFGDEDQIREDLKNGIPPKEPTPSSVVYRPRRGKYATMINPDTILRYGEMFFEVPENGIGTDYCKVKIGDGVTPYSKLHYAIDPWNTYVKDLAKEDLIFNDTLTGDDIDKLLDKIKSGAGMGQLMENIKASLVWLKTNHNNLKESYDKFTTNVADNYLTKVDAEKTYLTIINAQKTYLTLADAKKDYVTWSGEGDLTNKTYNGYTLGNACKLDISDATEGKIFANNEGEKLTTERRLYYGTPQFNGAHTYNSNTNYHVHPGMEGGAIDAGIKDKDGNPIYRKALSQATGNGSTDHPEWVDPLEIHVGSADKAKTDWSGRDFETYYINKGNVEEFKQDPDQIKSWIEETISSMISPSLLTPISYHRALIHNRSILRRIDNDGGLIAYKANWFQEYLPNIQLPYGPLVNSSYYPIINDRMKELKLNYNFSSLLVFTVASRIKFSKPMVVGSDKLLCVRMDNLTWSPIPYNGKFPVNDAGAISPPKRKLIWYNGYKKKDIWKCKWTDSIKNTPNVPFSPNFNNYKNPLSDADKKIIDERILRRNVTFYIAEDNLDVSTYVFKLDLGPNNLRYVNNDISGELINLEGDAVEGGVRI